MNHILIDSLQMASLALLLGVAGCDVPTPKQPVTRYEQPHRDVQWIDASGQECALLQCGDDGGLCLFSPSYTMSGPGHQRYILGRSNGVAAGDAQCSPQQSRILGDEQ